MKRFFIAFVIIVSFAWLSVFPASAQPSGGPYGPVKQKYDLPAVTGKIYYVAPDGKAGDSGESLSAPTTIESAFEKVMSGDAIVLRGGTYRTGDLLLNQNMARMLSEQLLRIAKFRTAQGLLHT